MKILVKASCLSEYADWADFLFLDLSDRQRQDILRYRDLFLEAKRAAPDLYLMEFWEAPGEFYEDCAFDEDLGLSESDITEYDTKEVLVLQDSFELPPEMEPVRTECDRLIVWDTGFYYKSIVKHTDVYVESREIPFQLLHKKGEHDGEQDRERESA